jgi:phosphotransferase system  glucose/maltose/N-acetylglucosamine-specific IIC component
VREIRWGFESGWLNVIVFGYEEPSFVPGGLHDWLTARVELWLAFGREEPDEGSDPAAELRARTDEASIGADELADLRRDLGLFLDGRLSKVAFRPFEQDLAIALSAGDPPTLAAVVRSGLALTTLDPQAIEPDALQASLAQLDELLGTFPARS